MTCKNCGKPIERRGFDWVHSDKPFRYRCGGNEPQPDPQKYAEPESR